MKARTKVVLFLLSVLAMQPAAPGFAVLIDFEDQPLFTSIAGKQFGDLIIGSPDLLIVASWGGLNKIVFSESFENHLQLSAVSGVSFSLVGFNLVVPSLPGVDDPLMPEFTIEAFNGIDFVSWDLVFDDIGNSWWSVVLLPEMPVTHVKFEWSGFGIMDNFQYEAAAPVPEPGTIFLLASGLTGLVAINFRKRRTNPVAVSI